MGFLTVPKHLWEVNYQYFHPFLFPPPKVTPRYITKLSTFLREEGVFGSMFRSLFHSSPCWLWWRWCLFFTSPYLHGCMHCIGGTSGKEHACQCRRCKSSILGSRRSPGRGHGKSLQYSCLENLLDRGAWWATVHWVTKNQTWLKQLSIHACICCRMKVLACFIILGQHAADLNTRWTIS